MTRCKRYLVLSALFIMLLVIGSAWLIATHLKTPQYVHRSPEQGLHPRDAPPFNIPHWQGFTGDPKESLGLDYQTVEFAALDGSTLRGWLVPAARAARLAVVAVHGGEGDRRSFLRHVPLLHAAGYPVLLFDYREHGISDGDVRGIAFGWRAHEDVSSAVAFMKQQRGFETVAAMGTSMGAVASILAAAEDTTIDAVIAENPFTSAVDVLGNSAGFDRLPRWYHQLVAFFVRVHFGRLGEPDAIDVVDKIAPRPLLLMHGTGDTAVHYSQSQRLYARAGDPKSIWILDGARHTQLFDVDPMTFKARVLDFLAAVD